MFRLLVTSALAVVLTGATFHAQLPSRAAVALEAAKQKETVEGDLDAALRQYEAIAAAYETTDRAVAAQALLRVAEVYRRLGDARELAVYDRIQSQFADQADVAAIARARRPRSAAPSDARGTSYHHVATFGESDGVAGNRVAADGRYVPFTRWSEGALYLRDLRTGLDRQLTVNPLAMKVDAYAESAVLSRDSAYVAYSWYQEGLGQQLRVLDARQSGLPEPRVLYANPDVDWIGPNDWSPDGSWIAVTIVRKDRSLQLGRVDAGTGRLRVLKSFTDWRSLSDAVISPDGRFIAFDEVPPGTFARDIRVLTAGGNRELTVVTGSSDDLPVGWMPDGGLLFLSDRSGSPSLWVQPFDGTSAGATPTLVYRDAAHFYPAGVTATGAVFTVPPQINTSRLRTITADLATGDLLTPVADLPADAGGVNDSAEWSSDGRQLAYVARRRSIGGRLSPRLVIRAVETGRERELRLDAQNIGYPSFSPDGRRLTVISYRAGQQFVSLVDPATGEVSTVAATTGERERLIGNGGPPTAPSWSRDGRLIFFRRVTPSGWRLFTFDVGTRSEVEIAAGSDPQGNVSVTADGTRIYYRRWHGSPKDGPARQEAAFVERDLTTGRERELHRRFNLGTPNLSPDGRYLVTGSVDESATHRAILLISTSDGTVRELLRVELRPGQNIGTGNNNPIVPAGWAPDSRSLLMRRRPQNGPAEVWWAPIDGRQPRLLVTGSDTARARIGADNRTIVFVEPSRDDSPEELWVLDRLVGPRR